MKPQQVKGTVFADLDDEKLYHVSFIFLLLLLVVYYPLLKVEGCNFVHFSCLFVCLEQ